MVFSSFHLYLCMCFRLHICGLKHEQNAFSMLSRKSQERHYFIVSCRWCLHCSLPFEMRWAWACLPCVFLLNLRFHWILSKSNGELWVYALIPNMLYNWNDGIRKQVTKITEKVDVEERKNKKRKTPTKTWNLSKWVNFLENQQISNVIFARTLFALRPLFFIVVFLLRYMLVLCIHLKSAKQPYTHHILQQQQHHHRTHIHNPNQFSHPGSLDFDIRTDVRNIMCCATFYFHLFTLRLSIVTPIQSHKYNTYSFQLYCLVMLRYGNCVHVSSVLRKAPCVMWPQTPKCVSYDFRRRRHWKITPFVTFRHFAIFTWN